MYVLQRQHLPFLTNCYLLGAVLYIRNVAISNAEDELCILFTPPPAPMKIGFIHRKALSRDFVLIQNSSASFRQIIYPVQPVFQENTNRVHQHLLSQWELITYCIWHFYCFKYWTTAYLIMFCGWILPNQIMK